MKSHISYLKLRHIQSIREGKITKERHCTVLTLAKMRLATAVFLVLLITLVMVVLSEARGGGSRGSRSRSSGSSSKPKITKYTPIKATSVRSPVIRSQAKQGLRSSTFKRAVVGYLVYRYAFSNAPVYRHGYPMYRSYVSIPEDRAVRVSYEEDKLLDDEGELCLGADSLKESQTLEDGIDERLAELSTTVKYSDGRKIQRGGVDNTVSLEDIKDKDFEVTCRARYNTSIVTGTNCTQVEKTVKGTMVTMYETNPNGASQLNINNKLFPAVIALFVFINLFRN